MDDMKKTELFLINLQNAAHTEATKKNLDIVEKTSNEVTEIAINSNDYFFKDRILAHQNEMIAGLVIANKHLLDEIQRITLDISEAACKLEDDDEI